MDKRMQKENRRQSKPLSFPYLVFSTCFSFDHHPYFINIIHKTRSNGYCLIFLSFILPRSEVFYLIKYRHIAFVPGFSYPTLIYSLYYRTARLGCVGTGRKTAISQIRFEFSKSLNQILFIYRFIGLHIQCWKPGSIGNICVVTKRNKLDLSCCVTASAKLSADVPCAEFRYTLSQHPVFCIL